MTTDRQVERLLDAWFTEGAVTVSDRVIDDVAARLTRQPQRPAWRLRPWRSPTVSTSLKLVLIGAALVAALAAGAVLVGGGWRKSAPTPIPTTSPTPPPSTMPLTEGPLDPGTYLVRPFPGNPLTWTVTVPAGWRAFGDEAVVGPERPGNIGTALVLGDKVGVTVDSCNPDGTPPAATVDDFIASVEARDDWIVSEPVDITVSGYAGRRIDVELPADVSSCGPGSDYFVTAEDGRDGWYAQAPSNRFTFWALDVEGSPKVFIRSSFATVPAHEISDTDAMVESSVITP